MSPLLSSFVEEGKTIGVEWYDSQSIEDLLNVKWQQIYAIGNLDGKVPVVLYETDKTNLPGGRTEVGETVQQTLERELEEEINCRVVSWRPIGYQKLAVPGMSEPVYQLRVYAKLEKIGEFENDPGGNVIGYELIELNNLNKTIHYGNVGECMMELVASEF